MIEPITIGKGKGIVAMRNIRQGGLDVAIVKLNKKYRTGSEIGIMDIEGFDVILHFPDRESYELTLDVLGKALKQWK